MKSEVKGQFCTTVLQGTDDENELVFECEAIYDLYIALKHYVGGPSTGKGKVTSQDA